MNAAMSKSEIGATGRRKTASARVRVCQGSGKIKVNGENFDKYFNVEAIRGFILQPLTLTGLGSSLDVCATITGGGKTGQAGALRHGIARALIKFDESLRPVLKNSGMLTRDSREKERKKAGQPGARKRFQFSKR